MGSEKGRSGRAGRSVPRSSPTGSFPPAARYNVHYGTLGSGRRTDGDVKRGFFSLRRLRWKLALSYALVTLSVLLMLLLVYVSVVLVSFRSDELPRRFAEDLSEFAPRLAPEISRLPAAPTGAREDFPDFGEEILQEQMAVLTGAEGSLISTGASVGYEGNMIVLDAEQRVLDYGYIVQSLEGPPGRYEPEPGERLDAGRTPGLEPLLERASNGVEDPDRLHTRTGDGDVVAAAPVISQEGRIVGAVVATLRLPGFLELLRMLVVPITLIFVVPVVLLGVISGSLTARGLTKRIERLDHASDAWSRGDFSVTVNDRSKDELGHHARSLDEMAGQLDALIQARGELATVEARNRLARDLHDSVKQQVYATSLQVDTARALIDHGEKADVHLTKANKLLEGAQKELGTLIQELRPPALEDKGLATALRDYATEWSRTAEVPVDVRVRGEREAPFEVELALFRVVQEALANAAKHSGAEHLEVDLGYEKENVTLRVTDDGRGFDPTQETRGGFGLKSMKERLSGLGGYLVVKSAAGGGTQVICVCPLNGNRNGRDGA